MRIIGKVGLSTREACGNTVRNVTGCPFSGVCADEPFDVTPYAAAYARYFLRHPVTQAMPRKSKPSFSGCEKDCAMTSIHDIGFVPRLQEVDGEMKRGFKMVVGGGLSIMARIAPTLYEFVPEEDYLKVSEAVLRVFDASDELRKNRMKARIKFLVDRIGIDEFRLLVEEELTKPWAQQPIDPTPLLYPDDEEIDAPPANGRGAATHRPTETAASSSCGAPPTSSRRSRPATTWCWSSCPSGTSTRTSSRCWPTSRGSTPGAGRGSPSSRTWPSAGCGRRRCTRCGRRSRPQAWPTWR